MQYAMYVVRVVSTNVLIAHSKSVGSNLDQGRYDSSENVFRWSEMGIKKKNSKKKKKMKKKQQIHNMKYENY